MNVLFFLAIVIPFATSCFPSFVSLSSNIIPNQHHDISAALQNRRLFPPPRPPPTFRLGIKRTKSILRVQSGLTTGAFRTLKSPMCVAVKQRRLIGGTLYEGCHPLVAPCHCEAQHRAANWGDGVWYQRRCRCSVSLFEGEEEVERSSHWKCNCLVERDGNCLSLGRLSSLVSPVPSMIDHEVLALQNLDRCRCQAERISNSLARRLRARILLGSSGVGKIHRLTKPFRA